MKHFTRFKLLSLAIGVGLISVILMMGSLSAAAATGDVDLALEMAAPTGDVDLTLEMEAPTHVAVSSTYVVRIGYYNLGTAIPPNARVTATLPAGTQFVTSTDRWDDPLPPDVIDDNVLSWHFDNPLLCQMPLDANCGHIVITLETDGDLPNGTVLTTTAYITTTAEDSDTTNNEASVVSLIGAMAGSTKQVHARYARPGDVLSYTITLDHAHETGGSNWKWVTLTDTLPFSHQVRFLGWSGPVTATRDGHLLRWQGKVQAGEPITFQYRLGVLGVVTPGTVITNVATLAWDGIQMQLGPVTTVVTLPHGTMVLERFQGGQLYHRHGVTLTVPPGTVTDTTQFRLGPLFTNTRPISTPPGGLLFANRAFELNAFRFGEPVREFSRPLTITMNYTDADVAGLKRETLRLWTRSGPEGPWAMLPARVMSGSLAFTTTHFSQFALFAEGTVDLDLEMEAPAHVAVSSTYEVRIGYYNLGTAIPPNAWVTATLPEGTQFVTSTDRWDDPLPPDVIDDNVLSWHFDNPLLCQMPLDANCGHIVITLETDGDLPNGTVLTTTAYITTTAEDSDTTNNEASVVSLIGAMAGSTKQVHARYARPGDVLSYTITLDHAHETGGSNWKWVTLTDTLPFSHQVRFLGWSGPVTATRDGHLLRWQGKVQAGEPITFQYRLGVLGVVTPGTVITNVATLAWDGIQMQLGPVTTVVTLPHGTMVLERFQGGQLYHRHGVTLTVPPGTVTDTTQFRLGPLFTNTRPISTPPGGLLFANRAFELNAFRFGEPVREFSRPLTITMNYTDTDVAGLRRETLRLWTRTGPQGPWAKLGEPARVMSGSLVFPTLTFTTTHLSQFALFGEAQYHMYLPAILR